MTILNIAQNLVKTIQKSEFKDFYTNELSLEKDVYNILRNSLAKILNLKDRELDDKIFTHGETREEKKRWSSTKVWQDVIICGTRNTSDIVIRLSEKDTIAIQLKYARGRITTSIQTVIGQCIIASLRHPAVIGLVFTNRKKECKEATFKKLLKKLKGFNIFLVIKNLT